MSLFRRIKATPGQPVPTERFDYPGGVCVKTESGYYYLKGGKKFRIKSDSVLRSWSFPIICDSTDSAIAHYKNSLAPLGFRDGTVVRDVFDYKLYIIADGKKYPVESKEMYDYLGLTEDNVVIVSSADIKSQREGSWG